MRTTLVAIIFSALCFFAVGQPPNVLGNNDAMQLRHYATLPDSGYAIEQILTDSTLKFVVNDSLRPSKNNTYWIKITITNTSHYDAVYYLKVLPQFNNTLYFFDADSKKWITERAGLMVSTDHSRVKGMMLIKFRGQTTTTIFIKVNLPFRQYFTHPVKPQILLENESATNKQETLLWIIWISSLSVLLIFFLNNLHVYFSFRDKTVLYFLVAQFGGMLYITSFRYFFDVLFFSPPSSLILLADGTLHFYNLNYLLMHLSVLLVMYGFSQVTRYYFNTQKVFPKLDAIISYGLNIYGIATVAMALVNCFWFYLDEYTLLYDNIFILLLLLTILFTSVMGYVRKLAGAKVFLLANLLPLLFMLAMAGYNVFVGYQSKAFLVLPDLTIISQAISFSVAIVARIRYMRNSLTNKELEVQQLVFDIKEMELKQRLINLENEQIGLNIQSMESKQRLMKLENEQKNAIIEQEKNKNGELNEKLEANQRKLASSTLYIEQKNKMLSTLKTELEELVKRVPDSGQNGLTGIQSILKSNLYLDADWEKFKLHFEQVHPNFFEELQAKHPLLTKNELRLFAYFHINLSTKEIAALLNIDPASVRRAKTRLYKKLVVD